MTAPLVYDRFGDPIPQSLRRLQKQGVDPEDDARVVDAKGFRDPALRARVQRVLGVEMDRECWERVRRHVLEGYYVSDWQIRAKQRQIEGGKPCVE